MAIESAALKPSRAATGYTSVLNGRFKGGWTTRHYGAPGTENVHAIQMELAQSTYLTTEAPPFAYDPAREPRPSARISRPCWNESKQSRFDL